MWKLLHHLEGWKAKVPDLGLVPTPTEFSLERWLTGGKDWNGWNFHKIRTYCRFTAWLARCLGNVPHLFWKRSFHMDQLVKCINGLEERPITPRGVAGGTRTAKDLVQLRWLENPWAFHGSLHHQPGLWQGEAWKSRSQRTFELYQ